MNIAFTYPSVVPSKGGCETYLADLIRRLARDGHSVHLYSVNYDPHALPPNVVHHPIAAFKGLRFLRSWHFAAECARALNQQRHDVVVGLVGTWRQDVVIPQGGLYTATARFTLHKHRWPFLRALCWLGQRLSPVFWSYAKLEHMEYHQFPPPYVVAPSRFVLGHLVAAYGYGPNLARVNHNAVDPRQFAAFDRPMRRLRLREELGLAPSDVAALFVGHNYRLKGLDPLLRAMTRVRCAHCHLIVCGSRNFAGFQRRARRLGIGARVHFLGFVKDVRDCYYAADFLVHPTFYDPCALVTMEAMACALPIITTLANGASELLPEVMRQHVIDNPHDAANLAHHIEQLCNGEHRSALARVARQTAAAWTFEDHFQALLKVFQEAAARKQAA
jgi:UDP-glucose:(heptosyl)LPS alpha-1,3-glucosyltransferase